MSHRKSLVETICHRWINPTQRRCRQPRRICRTGISCRQGPVIRRVEGIACVRGRCRRVLERGRSFALVRQGCRFRPPLPRSVPEGARSRGARRTRRLETTPEGALALMLLLDQFPRNSFRGTPRMYASDAAARRIAAAAIDAGHDRRYRPDLRLFFYLPFAHSENLADQERCVALCHPLGPPDSAHAKAPPRHRASASAASRIAIRFLGGK